MPAWLEVLLNVIGYGGFIAIAMLSSLPQRKAAGARPALSRIAQLDQRTVLPDQCLPSAAADVRPQLSSCWSVAGMLLISQSGSIRTSRPSLINWKQR
jgi:hypothetical protein